MLNGLTLTPPNVLFVRAVAATGDDLGRHVRAGPPPHQRFLPRQPAQPNL